MLPAATTGDTRNALIVIIVAPSFRLVLPPGMEEPGIFALRLKRSSLTRQAIF